MPTKLNDFRPLIENLASASPVIAAGQAIAKVGALAQNGAERVRDLVTPKPTPKRGDIALPRDTSANLGRYLHPPKKGR